MEERETVSLLKRRRKGLLRIVFSRFAIILTLLLLEILLVFSAFRFFSDIFPVLSFVQSIFAVLMILYLFNCGMDSSAKLTWLALIMVSPVPSSILLWYTQKNFTQKMLKRRIAELSETTRGFLKQDESVLERAGNEGLSQLHQYLEKAGSFPVYDSTASDYYPSGEAAFPDILKALESARDFIFIETFIIDEGYMWGSILKILCDKAREGVDVRVLYDGMCEMSSLSIDYSKRVERLGIKCRPFAKIMPFLSSHYNYRDHRKMIIVDGKVAFTGGINLADEYINRIKRFGYWKDAVLRLQGSCIGSFSLMFLQMWQILDQKPDWSLVGVSCPDAVSDGYVLPFADSPLDNHKVGESVYIDILYSAREFVHIMTPYLVLDDELERALRFASERGVEVSIILPGIPDKKTAFALAKTYYPRLLASGVHIYEYTPGFVHSKVFSSDGTKAVVGTINLDYRSLYHHFECATFLYGAACIDDIERDFSDTLSKCRAVTLSSLRKEKLFYRIAGPVLKLVAPLM